ncbi:hypothetical protein BDE40_2687 [Litoreibacter halocynthiae]|uniref:Lipoprotein n=1 Tax=Litoreibacter halocynthiae TaxID=1242689 RepID=A0A4R7LFH9_9RHOB|nr:hypothetical protein [Litoreibacter halocynthiae]TDT73909.1 hypothetical protein BDE40_2687 [Litoreibacter halocynthiae]
MRLLHYFFLTLLSACAAPSVGAMGGSKGSATVGAYSFDVKFRGGHAEAYRSNIALKPKSREVFAAGTTAIERVTGCHVVRSSVRGDVAVIQADILC